MTDDAFDVVVVGGGGSGLAAALAAASGDARVALIEKNPKLGGTTGLSIGSITASGTALQRSAGVEDSPDAHFADFDLFAKPGGAIDNLALRRLYVDHVADTLHWPMSPDQFAQMIRSNMQIWGPLIEALGITLDRGGEFSRVTARCIMLADDPLCQDGVGVAGFAVRIDTRCTRAAAVHNKERQVGGPGLPPGPHEAQVGPGPRASHHNKDETS